MKKWLEECLDELEKRSTSPAQPLQILEKADFSNTIRLCTEYSDPLLSAISELKEELPSTAQPRANPYDVLVSRGINYGADLYFPPAPYLRIVKILRLESGCITWSPRTDAVFLSEPMASLWEMVGGVTGIFGEPHWASRYKITGRDDADWTAAFEGGSLTIGEDVQEVVPYTAFRFLPFMPAVEQENLGRPDGIGKLDGYSIAHEKGMTFWVGGEENCNLYGPLYVKWLALGGMTDKVSNPTSRVREIAGMRCVDIGADGGIVETGSVAWHLPSGVFRAWAKNHYGEHSMGAPLGDPAGDFQRFEAGLFNIETGAIAKQEEISLFQSNPVFKLADPVHPFDVPPLYYGKFPEGIDPHQYWTS